MIVLLTLIAVAFLAAGIKSRPLEVKTTYWVFTLIFGAAALYLDLR